ncbi:hypothetical protein [Brevundimonas sp. DWR2-3-1b1]|uniref:hypothetical protein n=1 Tax=unclassified Brevundimonas TaxID=2622653 RepID=UPI003CED4890
MTRAQTDIIESFRHDQKVAIRNGKIAINEVMAKIVTAGRGDREFLLKCQSIEKSGDQMVDGWIALMDDARDKTLSKATIITGGLTLIEDFIRDAKTWKRIPPAFGSQRQNVLMDEELDEVRQRLEDRFKNGLRKISVKPVKRWHERNPVRWALGLIFIAAVVAFMNFLAQTFTKPLIEPTATHRPR